MGETEPKAGTGASGERPGHLSPALEVIYMDVVRHALDYARQHTDPDDAEDVAQTIALNLWRRWSTVPPSLRPPRNAAAFARQAVRHHLADTLAQEQRRKQRDVEHEHARQAARQARLHPAALLAARELGEVVAHALRRMPDTRRRAYLAVREDGNTYQAVAQQEGVKPATVRSNVRNAVHDLRRALARSWYDGFAPTRAARRGSTARRPENQGDR